MLSRLRVRVPGRLHFGLLGWGVLDRRQFGGVGLMIEQPGLEVVVERSGHWDAEGPLAERALRIVREVATQLKEGGLDCGPLIVRTLGSWRAHVGLGVGTQLSLAIARAMTELVGLTGATVETLARLTDRGRRSGIGIHGFDKGGLIIDGGRGTRSEVPTCLVQRPFPRQWSILIVIPESGVGLHGDEELEAFNTLQSIPDPITDRLCRLVLLGLLPALIETDLRAFGLALQEIQSEVGKAFGPVQGGRFSAPDAEAMVQRMSQLGLHGAGQSSWGPTLYAFSVEKDEEKERVRRALLDEFSIPPESLFWTSASSKGAEILGEEP
ncbi:MAG: beta-ribofuranosylaminobenzene 5'-phosphate synthase [Isosphaeraceae bacterium]